MDNSDPILAIKKFWLADQRPGFSRIPGACLALTNLFPNLTGEERVRPGYSAYASTDGGSTPGIDPPTGMEILKVGTIQSPSQNDVHLWFTDDLGTRDVYMNPKWNNGVKYASNFQVDETVIIPGAISADESFPAANQLQIANLTTHSFLTAVTGYYNGWMMYDDTLGSGAQVQTYVYNSGGNTGTFTFVEDVNGGSPNLNWVAGNHFTLYHSFHDNMSFHPTYNNNLVNPPTLNSENSILRWSGGQGSDANLRGVWCNPLLVRSFFPDVASRNFSLDTTYAAERELKSIDIVNGNFAWYIDNVRLPSSTTVLTADRTFWVAIAPEYDGFQVGKLKTYETVSTYPTQSGTYYSTTHNYVATSIATEPSGRDYHLYGLNITVAVSAASLNKRLTGFRVYIAQDVGQQSTRQSPYLFVKYVSLVQTSNPTTWSYGTSGSLHQVFYTTITIQQSDLDAAGNTYQADSGIVELPTDIMYSYSTEEILENRRLITNAYVTTETLTDRQNIFTNPVQGATSTIAPDMFSNEEAIYRLRIDPTIGTKINAVVKTGINEFLVIKDRGLLLKRINLIGSSLIPDLQSTIISYTAGTATINCYALDDEGFVYFPGYSDVFRYRSGQIQALIERQDKNDWIDTYKNSITNTFKENSSVFYVPELKAIYFLFGNNISPSSGSYNQLQYVFFPMYGWRDIKLGYVAPNAETSFKWTTKLQNGHVLGVTTATTPTVKRLIWKYSAIISDYALYYSDDGTAYPAILDTGDFVMANGRYFQWSKLQILRNYDSLTTGSVDCAFYLDGSLVKSYTGLDNSANFLEIASISNDKRIGYSTRFIYNTNVSTPEKLNAGSKLQFEAILLYGDTIPLEVLTPAQGGTSIVQILGTIAGVREVVITSADTDQTFTFDVPFTDTYVGQTGLQPAYRFDIDSAHQLVVGVEDVSTNVTVSIVSKTLTTITLRSSEDNTLVRYSIS